MSYKFADSLRAGSGRPDPARKLSANLYDIYHCVCTVKTTPDDRQRNCSKHVEFYSKNEFEKLVHLVGNNMFNYLSIFTFDSLRSTESGLVARRDSIPTIGWDTYFSISCPEIDFTPRGTRRFA